MSRIAYTGARIFDGEQWWERSALVVNGDRLALGTLVVSSAATPTFQGPAHVASAELAVAPRLSGVVTGLSDLPSIVTAATIGSNNSLIYARVA